MDSLSSRDVRVQGSQLLLARSLAVAEGGCDDDNVESVSLLSLLRSAFGCLGISENNRLPKRDALSQRTFETFFYLEEQPSDRLWKDQRMGRNASKTNLSILTIHYRSDHYRPKLVASLAKHTRDYEQLEHSNDDDNLGFSKANNKLIRKSRGQFVILLNPDSEVTQGWADRLIEEAEKDPRVGIVAPKLLQFNGMIDSTGHDYTNWPYTIADRGQGESDHGQYDSMRELVSCNFGCVLIKRSLIEEIGLLDERFFLYYEDVEYCHRARKAGWRIAYCPKSVVYHQRHGSGHNKWMDESRRYLPYILRKYYPKQELAKWYLHKGKATLAGLRNKDFVYASSNFRAMINGVW